MKGFLKVTNKKDGLRVCINISYIIVVWDNGDSTRIVNFEPRRGHSDTFEVRELYEEVISAISVALN